MKITNVSRRISESETANGLQPCRNRKTETECETIKLRQKCNELPLGEQCELTCGRCGMLVQFCSMQQYVVVDSGMQQYFIVCSMVNYFIEGSMFTYFMIDFTFILKQVVISFLVYSGQIICEITKLHKKYNFHINHDTNI